MEDSQLLRDYVEANSERAFGTLVNRYLGLVHSAALRQVQNSQMAEEVAQVVFLLLARKAGSLPRNVVLPGWLFRTTRFVAARAVRGEQRRLLREQEAFQMQQLSSSEDAWRHIAPMLDEAMDRLGEADRNIMILRFFQGESLQTVGDALGISEEAAKKRASRAVEKLRTFFARRGIAVSAGILLAALGTHSVQAVPAGLAPIITTAAAVKGATASGSILSLLKTTLKIMAWTKAKTVVAVAAAVIFTAGTTTVVVKKMKAASRANPSWAEDERNWTLDSRVLDRLSDAMILRPTRYPNGGGSVTSGRRTLGRNFSVKDLLAQAYNHSSYRIALPSGLPQERYDLLLTLSNQPQEALQLEIRKQFGLTAHREARETDVLLLKSRNSSATGLKTSDKPNASMSSGPGGINISGGSLNSLTGFLESRFASPVIDQTGLSGRYDVSLRWDAGRGGEDEAGRIKRALLDQLGLELLPSREKIEMLVVERTGN